MQAKYILIRYVICLLIFGSARSQTATPNINDFSKIVDVLPPSPNASSLGKYGGIDVGLASGTSNINIPLFAHISSNLKTPISLSYTSFGFRVDEVPGRVGIGWSLNAGGVITRTVSGARDEINTRVTFPDQDNVWSVEKIQWMESVAYAHDHGGPIDAQPDLFSFNFDGHTGQFVLDSNLNPILLAHSNLRIERSFFSAAWNFKVTTDEGIQYYFGGDSAREVSMKLGGGDCDNSFPEFSPTAWYLKKIIHPNNDTINFYYDPIHLQYYAGLSQTMFYPDGRSSDFCHPLRDDELPILGNKFCETVLSTNAVILKEISSAGGGRVKFIYINRLDDGGDKLLSSIEVYPAGQTSIFKVFQLNYQYGISTSYKNTYSTSNNSLCYHPFLTQLSEQSADAVLSKKHMFTYNDINGLPPRLSYAQDHYGYFNGKANSTLVSKPESSYWRNLMTSANADKEVDPLYAQKGLLSSIVYPTGGKDTIMYEGNQVYKEVITYPAETVVSAIASKPYDYPTPPGIGITVNSSSIVISYNQSVRMDLTCNYSAPDHHDFSYSETVVTVIDENDNSTFFTTTLQPTITTSQTLNLIAGHSYKIRSVTRGYNVTGGAKIYYTPGTPASAYLNVNTGGIRIAKVITTDGITSIPMIKKYLYERLSNPGISSAGAVAKPVYEKKLTFFQNCISLYTHEVFGLGDECNVNEFYFHSVFSSSLVNLSKYGSSVTYASVIECLGENYENGGIEHQYTVIPDRPAAKILGEEVLGMPTTSNNSKNAKEIKQFTFRIESGNVVPIKQISMHYKEDTRVSDEVKAYVVNKKTTPPCKSDLVPTINEMAAYDLYSFAYLVNWIYIDSIRTWTYNNSGQNYVEDLSIIEYANPAHALPTKQTTYVSDGGIKSVINTYPQDVTLSGSDETARQALVSRYIIGPALQQVVNKGATQLYRFKYSYNIFPSGLVLKQADSVQVAYNPIEERRRFYSYNNQGQPLEQSKTADKHTSYVWNDLNTYPIAMVDNSTASDIAYTSFESFETGNWSISSSLRSTTEYFTGKKGYSLANGSVNKAGLSSARTYTLSYWSKNGSYTVTGSLSSKAGNTINGWTYYQHVLSGITIATITGTGLIDELRLYPSGAEMSTATYSSLIGVISECDINNRTTHYEYDNLGRLKLVRDQDRNILKAYDYKYKN